jgi:hypothetical protein
MGEGLSSNLDFVTNFCSLKNFEEIFFEDVNQLTDGLCFVIQPTPSI